MKWGRPIWTFFHVLSKKIKDEYFNLVINDSEDIDIMDVARNISLDSDIL
jgi:hypothetical protein